MKMYYGFWICGLLCFRAADGAEPAAVLARKKAIASTRVAIQAQLNASGGDWQTWYSRVKPAWNELDAKIVSAGADVRTVTVNDAPAWSYLRGEGKPPMFVQTGSANYLTAQGMAPDEFLSTRPAPKVVSAFNTWLKQHDVDLIFVPVPKMVEVYPDRVLSAAPEDRILAPHMRKMILQLIDDDVEVLDLLPEFLNLARSEAGPVFLSSDSHWTQAAQKVTSKLLAERLARYSFVKRARREPPRFQSELIKVHFLGADHAYLTPEERKEVEDTWDLSLTQICESNGKPYEDPEDGAVVMIGDSYVHYFSLVIAQGTGIEALLSKDLNLPVTNRSVGGGTTESLREFIQNPDILKAHKVVVWIATSDMFMADRRWDLPPFPVPQTVAKPHP